jgi:hypothetical protein
MTGVLVAYLRRVISSGAERETICAVEKPGVGFGKALDAHSRSLPPFENREGWGSRRLK